jgi:hypothetical protein
VLLQFLDNLLTRHLGTGTLFWLLWGRRRGRATPGWLRGRRPVRALLANGRNRERLIVLAGQCRSEGDARLLAPLSPRHLQCAPTVIVVLCASEAHAGGLDKGLAIPNNLASGEEAAAIAFFARVYEPTAGGL